MVVKRSPYPNSVRAEPVEGLLLSSGGEQKGSASTGSARTGFGDGAARLAGFAGAFLGWAPEAFWRATPADLAAVVLALQGEGDPAPPDGATMMRLREAFPDG